MPEVELQAGVVEYEDSGGEGPVLVMLHGLAMDHRLWDGVVERLGPGYRYIRPTFPFGSHRRPLRPDADLSLLGISRMIADLLEQLRLERVTLCFSDWSGGQVMVAHGLVDRVDRLVFVSCETAGNFPPGLGGKMAALSAKLPGGFHVMRQSLLRKPLRNLPIVYGQMSKHGVPEELMRSWLEPLRRAEIRRDLRKYVADVRNGARELSDATSSLSGFEKPVLVVWDRDGKMMPNDHGRKLAADFPDARLVEVPDSYTMVPIDRPDAVADALGEFVPVGVA